jgi:Tol biopolymer transport system component
MVIDPMAHFRGAGVDAPEARPAEPPTLSRTRRAGVGAVALLLGAAGFGLAVVALRDPPGSPRQAEPLTEIRNGALAFRASEIWVVNPDGSGLRRLNSLACINDACDVAEGSLVLTPWEWSPDGTRLACYGYAYHRDDEGGADYAIYLMSADGSEVTDLTSDLPELQGTSQGNPHWSPDGTRLAFDNDDGLYIVNADGSGLTKVAGGGFPTWSPDGTRIAFLAASKGGGNEIRIANADSTGEMTVTEGGGSLDLPAWSPDGSRIAYITWAKGAGPQLYVVNPDGTGETRLTDLRSDGMGGYSPSWSPDGSTIAIEVFEDGNWNIYLARADGSGVRQLTDLPGDENRPTWAPDGMRIAFMGSSVASSEGENTGSFDVYLIDPDGTDPQRLTDGAGAAPGALTWQPLVVSDESPSPSRSPPEATPTPSISETPVEPKVTAAIPAGAFLRGVAVGEAAVWASVDNANSGPDDHLLVRIDPTTNEIVDAIPLPEAGDLAVGNGSVWVLSHVVSGGAILRIDPSTSEIAATIPVGDQLSNIAIGEGAVWVTRATDGNPPSGEVVRIDATTNEIVDRIPVSGGWPRDLVIGEGSVWAYGHSRLAEHGWEASSLWRIDPVTNEAVVVVDHDGFLGDGGALPDNAAVGDGYVWAAAADEQGTGLRIDPATGEVARFEVDGGFAWPFLVEAGRVWFGRDEIRLLDTETLEIVDVVNAEIESIDAAFEPLTASLWVANYDGTITRIDLG